MSNIVPLTLHPHLVFFLVKEMKGETQSFAGSQCTVFDISPKSFIGRFILEHLEKLNYPIKDIQRFNFFAQIDTTYRFRKDGNCGTFYKKEKLGDTFVYLPEKYVDDVNQLFEEQFRICFFNFVQARSEENDLQIMQAIILFIEKYDLFECGFNYERLRKIYHRMKLSGLCSSMQGKLYRDSKV